MNERRAELIYGQVLQRMDMTRETGDEELQELIRMTLEEASEKEYLPLNEKIELSRELFHAFRKLDILQELLEDPKITEIMVNGTDHIFYEKGGRLFRSERKFMSEERLVDVIQQIVGEANRYVSEASPIVDARLKDGSRVNVVMKPVAVNGPILTIRTFPEEPLTMKKLIDCGSMTEEAAQFIRKLVIAKYNIFVSGGTGAGKTTFLNAMSDFIPKDERIITIEDNAEMQIRGVENLVKLEARAVLNGAAAETAVLGAELERRHGAEEENLKEFFEERTSGKLILMTNPSVAITRTDNKIQVTAMVQKGRFELEVRQRAVIVNPEEKIRWIK